MHAPRICLCIIEDDLRSWVMDELLLMTWVATPTIDTVTDFDTIDPNLMSVVVVGVDRLAPRALEQLRSRTWTAPVIAIGKDAGIGTDFVLGPRLTSRELKQALRATLFDRSHTRESAVG